MRASSCIFRNIMLINSLDLVIVVGYMLGILVIGVMAGRNRLTTSNDYFLAGRSLNWLMVGAALFATNISTIHLVGLASDGYRIGLVVGNFEWMAAFTLILLGLVFAPFYFKSKITTLPEYLEKRYSPHSRTFLAFISVMSALLVHIGISLYAGAKVFEYFFNIDVIYSITLISVVTAVYTVMGGLRAVVVTETIQTFILLIGALSVTVAAFMALPSVGIHSLAELKAAVKPDQVNMLHSFRNAQGGLNEYSAYSMILGYPILGIWYWCTDQTIVQRVLGAKTQRDAQLGPLFAGFLKLLPVFFMVLPGVLGYVLFKDIIGADNDLTLPVMIQQLLPTGLIGLVTAGLLAALMSTIAGALNSSATLVSFDIVKRVWPDTRDQTQILIGRITAVVVMLLAMAWSTQGGKFGSIFVAINKIPMMFAPAISCVFLWGVFWRRGTKEASLATLAAGSVVGAIYLIVDLPLIGDVSIITERWGIPFMQVGIYLFIFCSLVYYTISKMTPEPDVEDLGNLCWENPLSAVMYGRISGWSDPRAWAITLFSIVIIFYLILG